MTRSYRIGFMADNHLGYNAKCRTHAASGLNMRVRDGYLALRERITQMIEAEVDLVIDGGDLFHRSWPNVSDIVWAQQQLRRLHEAGIPVVGNTGNHDASSERGKTPATGSVHDPARGLEFVTEPYRAVRPVEGLTIHAVSHYGLAQSERLIPEPVDGDINIFTTHGAAMVPGHEVFLCVDSPGEQPIGLDLLLDDRYAAKLLGHYHGMGEVMDDVWYAGSSIRRGFSDPEGGRGWLQVDIDASGAVSVEKKFISQRPQHDLPRIDATGMTGAQVEEAVRANLDAVDLGDAIVRQVVLNCDTATRRGINQPAIGDLTRDTLMWMPDFRRPETSTVEQVDPETGETETVALDEGDSLIAAGSTDLPAVYAGWVDRYADAAHLAETLKPVVATEGDRHLRAASVDVETGAEFAQPEGNAA